MKWALLWSVLAWCAYADVHEIAAKIERLSGETQLKPKPPYHVYDPFARGKPLLAQKSLIVASVPPKALRVETILAGRAWVDGRWVAKGDALAGGTVAAITEGGIVIAYAHEQVAVALTRAQHLHIKKEPAR